MGLRGTESSNARRRHAPQPPVTYLAFGASGGFHLSRRAAFSK